MIPVIETERLILRGWYETDLDEYSAIMADEDVTRFVVDAARERGVSRQVLHGILAERLPVSAEMAVRLGRRCGNGSDIWIALPHDYDLWAAKKRLAPEIRTHKAA